MAQFKDLFTELRRDTGLSQEDFAALFHQSGSTISSYERGLVNYIITAAKNTAYNYCRDKKKELDFDFEQEVIVDNYDSLEDDIIKRENLFCLDQVWNSLDSKTQYLLSAKYLLNKSGKEIANDLGMSSDNVRMALVRAKRKARQAMEDWKHSTNQAK